MIKSAFSRSALKSQARNAGKKFLKDLGLTNITENVRKTVNPYSELGNLAKGALSNVSGSALRSLNLPNFGMPQIKAGYTIDGFVGDEQDWRVRISIPSGNNFDNSQLLAPLYETNGLVFPYTPQMLLQHSASYNQIQPIHTNYPYMAYQNSRVEQFSIVGDFFVESMSEANYWIAAIHFLRSVTKMAYGQTDQQGAPPPIVKVSGYGDYLLPNVPCVVTQFAIDLPTEVDYIQTPDYNAWVPVQSSIQVALQPIYSRSAVEQFSLGAFVAGYQGGGFI